MAESIIGLKKLLEQFKNIGNISFGDALLGGAYILQAQSQKNSPVDTGFLRNTHESKLVNDKRAEMQVTAEYAVYVEFGSAKWNGKPYLRPAIESEREKIVQYVRTSLENQIKKEGK